MKGSPSCLYCGKSGLLTREHIVPEALGATKWLKCVCSTCNNKVLSQLDNELVTKSPLSLVAASELLKTTGYTWDVDHSESNLLLEARADESAGSMFVWPQIIFDEKLQIRGDAEEVQQFGAENFQDVFVKHLLAAFQTVKKSLKRPRIVFDPVPEKIPPMYRCPPRLFATRSIRDFDNRMHFQCRYQTSSDKRRALHALDKWDSSKRFRDYATQLGSALPSFHLHYDAVAVVRSLTKIALNLLRFLCENTAVDREHLRSAVEFVTGKHSVKRRILDRQGFVDADSIQALGCPENSHLFRLVYDRGWWSVHFAFFASRVGAFVTFPGPSRETWRSANVVAPIGSCEWSVSKTRLVLPLTPQVIWGDLNRIIPSMPLTNVRSGMTEVAF